MARDPTTNFPVVAIGASAGGLEPLNELLAALPYKPQAAILFVQHLPPERKSLLPDLLRGKRSDLEIIEPENEHSLQPGCVYLVPGGKTLTFDDQGVLHVVAPPERLIHHTIDSLLASVATIYKERAVAVILSGTGNDGTRGSVEIRSHGGTVLVQDPAGARFPSMPNSVIHTGSVDLVLTPAAIGREIETISQTRRSSARIDVPVDPENLSAFYDLLYTTTGYRFNHYKDGVALRRLRRRMQLRGVNIMDEYLKILGQEPAEARQLAEDFMIGVTSFFRDPETWHELKAYVIRNLIAQKSDESTRVWTPACSTGAESYSIAVMLHDELEQAGKEVDFLVFASDINENALETARRGIYPGCFEVDIPPEYFRRHFVCSEDRTKMAISGAIRERLVFAKHDLLADPPFSKLDLIICRNLLIYLEPPAQHRCIDTFHYALRENRFLFLGKAESVGERESLFRQVGPQCTHIFQRLPGPSPARYPTSFRMEADFRLHKQEKRQAPDQSAIVDAARDALLERYAPAAVAIDGGYEILYNNGPVNRYLTPPSGEPTHNLLDLLPQRLRPKIRAAVYRIGQDGTTATIRTKLNRAKKIVTIAVSPLESAPHTFIVEFRESRARNKPEAVSLEVSESTHGAVRQLEDELTTTRIDLR
ncbi:MAG: hypothetical protein GF344_06675, partial [Chitinivibrionales bacterium]|nr:hypothetical protein [Chitinivibrionales bacterium]MBD3356611.1 hypothetical protein [Chitinivibrionales bacterium]